MKVIVPVENQRFSPTVNIANYNDSINWASAALGATATATSTSGSSSPTNAITGDYLNRDYDIASDCWVAGAGGTQTLTITLPQAITLRRIRFVNAQTKYSTDYSVLPPTVFSETAGIGLLDFQVQYFSLGVWTSFTRIDHKFIMEDFIPTGGWAASVTSVRIVATRWKPGPNMTVGLIQVFGQEADAWNSGSTYAKGAQVSFNLNVYESLQNGNFNKTPESIAAALWWIKVRSTTVAAIQNSELKSGFTGIVNDYHFFQMNVPTLNFNRICVLNALFGFGRFKFQNDLKTINLTTGATISTTTTFLDYANLSHSNNSSRNFENFIINVPSGFQGQVTTIDTANNRFTILNSTIILEVTNTTTLPKTISIGEVVVGNEVDLGFTSYGFSAGNTDYSIKTTDVYGKTSLVKRDFTRKFNSKSEVNNSIVDSVHETLNTLRATPCVWIASDDTRFNRLGTVYGFYKDFSTTIAYPTYSICDLQIEGLT